MIGTIRKHSTWLWFVIIAATIISFLFFFSPNQRMNGGRSNGGDFGSVYGKKITRDDYASAEREFDLFYFFHDNEWPDKVPADEQQREIYVRLLLIQKADDLGIDVSDNEAAAAADEILRSPELARALRIKDQSVPLDVFVKDVLQPKGLTAEDFENFVRHDLAIQQLFQTYGLAGELVTPQEAAAIYQREHETLSAQVVFFSATNYLPQVDVTPEAVAQFYTNYLAYYRLPDRVQVSYVAFNVTNYLAPAKAELAKTNLDEQVADIYDEYGAQAFPDEKTPEAAKAKIRELLIRQRALADARAEANEFASTVFDLNSDSPKPADLATVAKQKGLAVKTTAPFDSQSGPEEFTAPDDFTKAAFGLTSDEPFAGPIAGPDAVYVIALDKTLPSEIPPLAQIHARVTRDFKLHEATLLAQSSGTSFIQTLTNSLAGGKKFAAACVLAGFPPELLPPFSLNTREMPELDGRAELNQIKQAAFSTAVGQASGFEPTDDGGFVLYVESRQPADEETMNADLPQFLASLRRSQQNEAFNEWLGMEARKQFGNMAVFQQAAEAAK